MEGKGKREGEKGEEQREAEGKREKQREGEAEKWGEGKESEAASLREILKRRTSDWKQKEDLPGQGSEWAGLSLKGQDRLLQF